ncbi:MAG: PVC-type heme-binding CxxCH protein, partial [Bacteroidota bacterium]
KGNQKSDDGKVWVGGLQMSIQPDGTQLKVLGHNFRNSYETYIDGHGDMWQNDNDDQVVTCRVSWLAEGGNAGYFSEDGTRFWNADQRPSQDMFRAHWHQDDPKTMPAGDNSGAGSPTGMLRNEGDALGIRYRGMLLSADAGRNVLFAYHPKRTQSGYNLKGGRSIFLSSNPSDDPSYEWNNKTFLEDKTKWFRPSDILVGTDGALYVSDWYDAVVGGHQIKDNKAYGRIYRISPKNKKLTNPKLDLESLAGQVNAFKNSAVNVRNQAYSKLLEGGEKNGEAVKKLAADTNPFIKSRALWLLAAMNGKGQNFVKQKLKMGSEEERIVAMRAMRSHLDQEQLVPIIQDKTNDPSAFVRREAILALENFDYKIKNPLLISFAKKIPTEDQYYINAIAAQLQNHEEDFYLENKELLDTKFDLLFALHPNSSVPFFENIVKNPNEKLSRKQKAITAIGFIKSTDAVKAMVNLQKSKDEAVAEMAAYWLSFRSTNDWFDLYDWSKNKDDLEKQKQLTKLFGFKEKILNNYVAFADRKRTALEMLKSQEG